MTNENQHKVECYRILDREFVIDHSLMRFNETNLSDYLKKESGYYDHFCSALSLAEKVLQLAELEYEELYNKAFIDEKEQGAAVALAEAKAKAREDVVEAKKRVIDAKYVVNRIKLHLRAWDKNHDNAQSLGHTLRKQMDKLNDSIVQGNVDDFSTQMEQMMAHDS